MLGLGEAADAFAAAFRIPNVLQNLLGEGALSASFIPAYTRLRETGDEAGARALAGAVLGFLALTVAVLVALGVTFAPALVAALAPGFEGPRRDLTVQLVRVFFPGTGLLVLSAWCLGVLNSHRKFFLSYAAPVAWNAAIIVAALLPPAGVPEQAAVWAAWGALVGALLQVAVQVPVVYRVAGALRPSLAHQARGFADAVRTFVPAVLSRGVIQVSAFVDGIIASLLPAGGVAALLNAQLVYTLPVSLFGMSVAASELPALSAAAGAGQGGDGIRDRLREGLARIGFFVLPSAVALLAFGGLIAAALFETGRFSADDARYVWFILMGSAPGLVATTRARLVASAWYALQDTTVPLRAAAARVVIGGVVGLVAALQVPGWVGLAPRWGAVGLTLAGSLAGWVEYTRLRGALASRLGTFTPPSGDDRRLLLATLGALLPAAGMYLLAVPATGPILDALLVLGTFGTAYLGITWVLGVPEARALVARVARPA